MQRAVIRGSTSSVMVWYGVLLGVFCLATLAFGVVMAAVRSGTPGACRGRRSRG